MLKIHNVSPKIKTAAMKVVAFQCLSSLVSTAYSEFGEPNFIMVSERL